MEKFGRGSAKKRNFDYCKILMASSILFFKVEHKVITIRIY